MAIWVGHAVLFKIKAIAVLLASGATSDALILSNWGRLIGMNSFDMMRLRKILSVAAVSFGLLVCWCLCDQFWALTHTTWRPFGSAPLSADEILRMGAVDAVEDYCNTATDLTAKGESLTRRFVYNRSDAATAARKEAKESFRNEDCNELLIRFDDMMVRWRG